MQRIAITLLLFLFTSAFFKVSAQNGTEGADNVTITVTATVQSIIETITIQTIDFDGAEREGTVVTINPVESALAGKIIARGTPGSEFRLEFLEERLMPNTVGDGSLSFIYSLAGNDIDEQESAELLGPEVRDLEFNSDGEFFIWVGGTFDLEDVNPGSYEGEFAIEIEYI